MAKKHYTRYENSDDKAAAAADPKHLVRESRSEIAGRIDAFRRWLAARPERVIAVVGHSVFIKQFTGMPRKLRNCEVHRCALDASRACVD